MGPEPGAPVPSGGAGPAFRLFSDWSLFLGVSVLPSSGHVIRLHGVSPGWHRGTAQKWCSSCCAHGSVDSFCPLQAQHVMAP